MAQIDRDDYNFFQIKIYPILNPYDGGKDGDIYIDVRTGDGYYDLNASATDYYRFSPIRYNNTTSLRNIYQGLGATETPANQADVIKNVLGLVDGQMVREDMYFWYYINQASPLYGDGNDFSELLTAIENRNVSNSAYTMQIVVAYLFDTGEGTPSFCNDGIHYRYDDANDDLYVVFGDQDEYLIADGTITSQADLQTFMEAIYLENIWDYAYNTTTGEICVRYAGVSGTGEWNFSTELSEEINLGDSASAFIISRWPVNYEKWVR